VILAGTLAIVVTFFSRDIGVSFSRSFVLLFVPVSYGMLYAGRHVALIAVALVIKKWPARERVAVMGESAEVREMVDALRASADGILTVVGVIVPQDACLREAGNPVPVLGTMKQLGEVINRERLDRIVLAQDGSLAKQDLDECVRISKRMDVILSRAISVPDLDVRPEFTVLSGLNLIELKPIHYVHKQELFKRAFDVGAAAICLVLLLPVLVLFALLVKLTSKGPVVYKSRRVGKGGRHFTFFKFRSMCVGSEDRGELAACNEKSDHLFKIRNDPRITPVGRFMRHFSIDELPQLVNVLLGHMSMVGPRPLPAWDLDPDGQSRHFQVWAEQRSRVLPGVTGLWQVRGRSDLPFEKMIELDLSYIRDWSFWLDFRILLATPLVALSGRGAY
jgi:exopolysaccharide biosynthesis polyprenyl glycosylphosphotransferase